jgi:hypothetical protein
MPGLKVRNLDLIFTAPEEKLFVRLLFDYSIYL